MSYNAWVLDSYYVILILTTQPIHPHLRSIISMHMKAILLSISHVSFVSWSRILVAKNSCGTIADLSVIFLSKCIILILESRSLFQVISILLSLYLRKGLFMGFSFLFYFSVKKPHTNKQQKYCKTQRFQMMCHYVQLCTMQKKDKALHAHFRHALSPIPSHSVIGNPRFYV